MLRRRCVERPRAERIATAWRRAIGISGTLISAARRARASPASAARWRPAPPPRRPPTGRGGRAALCRDVDVRRLPSAARSEQTPQRGSVRAARAAVGGKRGSRRRRKSHHLATAPRTERTPARQGSSRLRAAVGCGGTSRGSLSTTRSYGASTTAIQPPASRACGRTSCTCAAAPRRASPALPRPLLAWLNGGRLAIKERHKSVRRRGVVEDGGSAAARASFARAAPGNMAASASSARRPPRRRRASARRGGRCVARRRSSAGGASRADARSCRRRIAQIEASPKGRLRRIPCVPLLLHPPTSRSSWCRCLRR